jgi:hypothetical protein
VVAAGEVLDRKDARSIDSAGRPAQHHVIDDDELIDKLESLTACIVVTKQGRDQRKLDKLQRFGNLRRRSVHVDDQTVPVRGRLPAHN